MARELFEFNFQNDLTDLQEVVETREVELPSGSGKHV